MARVYSKRDSQLRKKAGSTRVPAKPKLSPTIATPDTKCRACHREFGKYDMPEEAFRLREDIQTLGDMLNLLDRIDATSIARNDFYHYKEVKEEAYQSMRRVAFIIGEFQRIARDKLRDNFLAGERSKPRVKPETVADIWLAIMDTLKDITRARSVPATVDQESIGSPQSRQHSGRKASAGE